MSICALTVVRTIVVSAILYSIAFSIQSCVAASQPNILLFVADNWSWPHASTLGDPVAETPVFDRIAREGLLFRNAFCPVPSCSPTRSCILTGRAAHQLREAASLWSDFPKTHRVFTEMLQRSGYEVGFSGKGWSPGRFLELGWTQNPVGPQFKSFAEFMEKRDPTKPFFFWNGNTSTALHQWKNDQQDWSQEKLASVRVPPELPDSNAVRSSLLGYYQGVRRMDADAGACITELTNRKLLDDTLVIYLSDNGWQQPRGLANCYDSGTHVPMAMRWGNRLTAGRTVDEFVSLTDLAPTLLEIAGLPALVEMTGSSFVDLMMGKASSQSRDHVFLERERHANVRRGNLSYPIRGIRTKDFLYLWNMRPDRWPAGDPVVYMAVGDYGDVDDSLSKNYILMNQVSPQVQRSFELCFAKRPEEELFDLRNDASQIINVADRPDYAAVKKALRQKVEQWMRDTQDPRVDPNHNGWDNYAYYGGSAIGRGKEKAPKASGQ